MTAVLLIGDAERDWVFLPRKTRIDSYSFLAVRTKHEEAFFVIFYLQASCGRQVLINPSLLSPTEFFVAAWTSYRYDPIHFLSPEIWSDRIRHSLKS
ncbi:MAG: hypothetical protein V4646_16175 [Pseudomonadota bacterium]